MRKVYQWVVGNIGSTFSSPRERAFGRQTKDFKIFRMRARDLLELADEVEVGATYKPGSRRRLQGVRARDK